MLHTPATYTTVRKGIDTSLNFTSVGSYTFFLNHEKPALHRHRPSLKEGQALVLNILYLSFIVYVISHTCYVLDVSKAFRAFEPRSEWQLIGFRKSLSTMIERKLRSWRVRTVKHSTRINSLSSVSMNALASAAL